MEQSFLYAIHRADLIHIPVKVYEAIPNGNCVMARTRVFTDGRADRRQCHTIIRLFFFFFLFCFFKMGV